MKRVHKALALALGSVMSIAAFAACGGKKEVQSTGDAQNYKICFDNLAEDGISLDASVTSVEVKDVKVVAAYDGAGNAVKDWESIATYEDGVFSAVSAGRVRYQTADGKTGNIEVTAAYPTDPGNAYSGSAADFSEADEQGEKVLGRTHDPSLIEVRNKNGQSVYYMFSTGWSDTSSYETLVEGEDGAMTAQTISTYGNAIHVSYDGMKTWEFLGRTFNAADREKEVASTKLGEWLYGGEDDRIVGDFTVESASWWAPDIVPKPDGTGYWLYTCVVDGGATEDGEGILIDGKVFTTACILLYESETLEPGSFHPVLVEGQPAVFVQSHIDNVDGTIAYPEYYGNVNAIDPQIIYTPEGRMFMTYASFGSGNYILELDPATGLRKEIKEGDAVVQQGNEGWKSHEYIVGLRSEVLDLFNNYKDEDGNKVGWTHAYYGKNISRQFMEAPVVARHDNVTMMDAEGNPLEGSGKTYYYSMHSYDPLADNYQLWGGRSENVMGLYTSVNGGIVWNTSQWSENSQNQGNKYMGSFLWANKPEASPELDGILPGHNDLFTTNDGTSVTAYITRQNGNTGSFTTQLHQYYLNSYGDIVINPNRYAGESSRPVSADELFAYTQKEGELYKFEMAALTSQVRDNVGDVSKGTLEANNLSRTVLLSRDAENGSTGKIYESVVSSEGSCFPGAEIGTWKMYGNGYIKFEFGETLKGLTSTGDTPDTEERIFYGVVRTAWLNDQNRSGFTIAALGHTHATRSMPLFMNNYSTITGEGLVGTDYSKTEAE